MVLKKDGEDLLDRVCRKLKKYDRNSRWYGVPYIQDNGGRLTRLVTSY